jgi:Helix-turn-helix domain
MSSEPKPQPSPGPRPGSRRPGGSGPSRPDPARYRTGGEIGAADLARAVGCDPDDAATWPDGETGAPGNAEPAGEPGDARQERPEPAGAEPEGEDLRVLTDAKAMRALAHPVRVALLDLFGYHDTLTATQASELLGESPANCAFHLRTLAKYGFVEEAGGGRGRERPWRQTYDGMSWRTRTDDPQATQAAEALDQVWLDRSLTRARRGLTAMSKWPKGLEDSLGATTSRLYVTPAEADELYTEIGQAFERLFGTHHRFADRRDPKRRPADAVPVEFVLMGYPVLDLPPLPEGDEDTADETAPEG